MFVYIIWQLFGQRCIQNFYVLISAICAKVWKGCKFIIIFFFSFYIISKRVKKLVLAEQKTRFSQTYHHRLPPYFPCVMFICSVCHSLRLLYWNVLFVEETSVENICNGIEWQTKRNVSKKKLLNKNWHWCVERVRKREREKKQVYEEKENFNWLSFLSRISFTCSGV